MPGPTLPHNGREMNARKITKVQSIQKVKSKMGAALPKLDHDAACLCILGRIWRRLY